MKIFRVEFDARSMSTGDGIAKFPANFELMPPDGEPVKNWTSPSVIVPTGNNWDFLPSSIGARVCSPRLTELLSEYLTVTDYVEWLPIETEGTKRGENWRVLHFSKPMAVLDRSRSKFLSTGALIKPAFDPKLVENLAFFSIPGSYKFEFFVNEPLKKEAERRKMQGVFCKQVDELR